MIALLGQRRDQGIALLTDKYGSIIQDDLVPDLVGGAELFAARADDDLVHDDLVQFQRKNLKGVEHWL